MPLWDSLNADIYLGCLSMTSKRILVVGGTGLIGRVTVEQLAAMGAQVSLVSRHPPASLPGGVCWFECDILKDGQLQAIARNLAPDAVLHLAALLQFTCDRDPAMAVRVNVDGTLQVLEVARQLGIPRVVFGSSIAVYGETSDLMREESWQFGTTGLYGITKLVGESVGARYQAEFGVKFVALRYSGVFGPEAPDERVQSSGMSLVRKQILQCAGGSDVVVSGAAGTEKIHLTYVSDAALATCLAMLHPNPSHSIYNVAGPDDNYVSLQELYGAVRSLVPGAGKPIWAGAGKSAGPVDTSRIRNDLGFHPSIPLAEGLGKSLEENPLTFNDAG
jgi:UDP-glucose 4-epimerase